MSVAIDYSLSNGDPNDPKSLHFVSEVDKEGNRAKAAVQDSGDQNALRDLRKRASG